MSNAALSATLSASEALTRPSQPGFFRRLLASMIEARQRQADAAVARYIELQGGRLTDSLEREISRRFGAIVP